MSNLAKLKNELHLRDIFSKLAQFRVENRYCDVMILVDGRTIHAHKCVLAAGSEYFDNKLTELPGLSEKETLLEIEHGASYEITLKIVNYLYTGLIEYTNDEVMLVLESLNNLGIHCGTAIEKFVNNENCFELMKNEHKYCGVILKDAAFRHIADHLEEIYKTNGFKSLTVHELKQIFSRSTELNFDALSMFEALESWTNHDRTARLERFGEFLTFVQFDELNCSQIESKILKNDTLRKSATGCKWLIDGLTNPNSNLSFYVIEKVMLYVFTRGPDTTMYTVYYHSNDDDDFEQREDIRPEFDSFSMARHGKFLYAIGGKRHNQIVNIGLRYDTEYCSWSEFLCPIGKASCGVCTMKANKMFVVGGVIGNYCQKSCSSYDFVTGEWTQLPNMLRERWTPGVSTYSSSVYVFGGLSHDDTQTIVERYDPREGIWSSAGQLDFHTGTVATRIGHKIHCLRIGTAEIVSYDPRNMNFNTDFDLVATRGEWMAANGDKLYVLHKHGIDTYHPNGQKLDTDCYNNWGAYKILML